MLADIESKKSGSVNRTRRSFSGSRKSLLHSYRIFAWNQRRLEFYRCCPSGHHHEKKKRMLDYLFEQVRQNAGPELTAERKGSKKSQ
jgi:hypothetical protein